MRELDADDGFEFSSAPSAGIARTVTGSRSSPTLITAAGGITPAANGAPVNEELIYIAGSGAAIDVSRDPQILAGTVDGQKLILRGTHDTNTVLLENGTGLELNGTCKLGAGSVLGLSWDDDGAVWVEDFRNGVLP